MTPAEIQTAAESKAPSKVTKPARRSDPFLLSCAAIPAAGLIAFYSFVLRARPILTGLRVFTVSYALVWVLAMVDPGGFLEWYAD
jgi:hypothetical protein